MQLELPEFIDGQSDILLLCDHASDRVPPGIDLKVGSDLMRKHIAVDIGAGDLTRCLAKRLGSPAVVATVSRLVIDLHREPDHAGLIPTVSDGHAIPGNVRADRDDLIARFYAPYHDAIDSMIRSHRPRMIAAVHSFTPCLETGGADRPWQVGILYNRDDRAARPAIRELVEQGLTVGDNEPYSGRLLNATLNRHGEAKGIPCLSIEVRNDLISDAAGIARWCDILSDMLSNVRNSLAFEVPSAT